MEAAGREIAGNSGGSRGSRLQFCVPSCDGGAFSQDYGEVSSEEILGAVNMNE